MYTISYPSGTVRLDGTVIPQDEREPEHQAYVAWLAQGNGPEVLQDARNYSRIEVTAWKLIQALEKLGMLEAIDTAASNSTNVLVRKGWARAPIFFSDEDLVLAMCQEMGIDDDTRQNVFELAASL